MSFDPRFTRWRALFLNGTRNPLLQLQTSPPPELTVQYIQPSAAAARPLDGSSEELDLITGSLAGLAPGGGSGASMNP